MMIAGIEVEDVKRKSVSAIKPDVVNVTLTALLFIVATQLSGGWHSIITSMAGAKTQIGFPLSWALVDPTVNCVPEANCTSEGLQIIYTSLGANLIFWYGVSSLLSYGLKGWERDA